ncbi:MAG TPA: hypothetical protein VGD42_06650 [Lysobacter sp.]
MKAMTLMTVLALVAAAHSISTRTASASDVAAQARPIRTFDLPAVRVHATVERDTQAFAAQAPRVHDLPAVRVYAARKDVDARMAAVAVRAGSRRESLAIPRGSARRGMAPERIAHVRADDRGDRWVALGCMIRLRLARVWPMTGCNAGQPWSGRLRPRTDVGMAQASLARRR